MRRSDFGGIWPGHVRCATRRQRVSTARSRAMSTAGITNLRSDPFWLATARSGSAPRDGSGEARPAILAIEGACHILTSPLHVQAMDYLRASDARLLLASAKDARAFGVLYDRYADQIRRYHLRRCRDQEAAFDLVAETFAQAWCVRRAFRNEADGSAAPWLYGIARNVLRQSVRRERLEDDARQRLGVLEQSGRSDVTPEESWLEGADELLESLPAEQRQALEMRVVEDMTYDRVARRLAITPENARMRVHRALKALRDRHLRMTGEL